MLSPTENDCFSNLNQEFLICTTVHKARALGVFTAETFVRVTLDKESRMTKTIPNSENPYYNEYFVFELNCTVSELLRMTILYELRKRTTCKKSITLGELLIDIQSVWTQPNRCFFKKWGRLETPIGSKDNEADGGGGKDKDKKKEIEKGKGHLQIDLAIVSKATNIKTLLQPHSDAEIFGISKWQINQDYDDIEKNMLQNVEPGVECNIMYKIVFYRCYLNKKCDYMIQFRFHPFKGKTSIAKSTTQPEWNHEVSFAWTYPSLAQTFLIQLLCREHLQFKCIAEFELHFDEIAFKDKPALGPTFIHLYDIVNPSRYVGRLVIEVRSECLTADPKRVLVTRTVPTIDEQRWWQNETFLIEFLALQGGFIHGHFSNCKLSMKLAENTSNFIECFLKSYPTQHHVSTNRKFFKHECPYKAIVLKTVLPDNRHKFDSDFFMQEVVDYMKSEIETFKLFQLKYTNQVQMQTKCFKAIIISIHNKIKEGIDANRLEYTGFKDPSIWDTNRLIFLQDFFNKLPEELSHMRKRLKATNINNMESTVEEVLQELVQRSNELSNMFTLTRIQDEWPELLIVLSISGNKEIGVCRLNAKYFLNPPKDKDVSPSTLCWRSRNFVFKDMACQHTCVNCGCTIAIIQGLLGIVVEHERNEYLTTISPDWKQSETFYWNPTIAYTAFKCRLFIHQAKVRPGSDRTGLCDAHVRVIFLSQSAETLTERATLSPIWNTVISFECVCMPGSILWYRRNPPLIAVELYDTDRLTADDYLGCGMLTASIICRDGMDTNVRDDLDSERKPGQGDFGIVVKTKNALQKFQSLKNLSPPPLKWVPISMNGSSRAEVLMSAELVEVPCRSETIAPSPPTITSGIPNGIRPNMRNYVLEVVFAGFRNYNKSNTTGPTYMAGRHRIKLMMGDLLLQSGLSTSRIKNSINFLVLYASGVVCLPEQLEYWPAIIATDIAVSARGHETTVGAVLIPNSKRFLEKEKTTKPTSMVETDMESNSASTTVHMDDFENAETSPLLTKNNKRNMFNRIFCAFKPNVGDKLEIQPKVSKTVTLDLNNSAIEAEYNWWTKFYNSLYLDAGHGSRNLKHKLVMYPNELEKQAEFSHFHDWAEPVKLVHGVKYKKKSMPVEEVYATLKLHLKLTPCQCGNAGDGDGAMLRPLAAALNPRYQAKLQTLTELCKIVARVYIVQGIQFRPHDKHNQSDSYVQLQLGMKIISNRAHYVPNQSNPIFGKCFQLEGVLPREHVLEVSVFDRSVGLGRDDLVGSTYIDLEDRWRSRHRATMGIANEYCKNGYNKWRDISTPYEILTDLCMKNDMKPPVFNGSTIEVDGLEFPDETKIAKDEDLQERLSLTVLKNFDKLPSFEYKLLPEHVETRSLYRNNCPGIEQGKIQLWIELYEGNLNIPAAIDITPQPPQMYELRVTILNCADVILDEKNIFGKNMSDVFVKGWCHDAEQVQTTDIHYRSLNGEASFNWRMIFPVKYSSVEDMMVIKRKGGMLEEYETKQPPLLYLQIWDNDMVSFDDFLGALEVNLSNFPQPFDNQKSCTLPHGSSWHIPFVGPGGDGDAHRTPMNLFRQRRIKGWFPARGNLRNKTGQSRNEVGMTGKIELELEILSDAEAVANPAGFARNPPNALPVPVRPETSFNPFLNPIKSFTKIILPVVRKFALYIFIGLVVLIIVYSVIINLPSDILGWVFGGW